MHATFKATLSAGAYRTLVALVYQHSRIRLGPDKQPLLANRLRSRLRALGMDSFDEYCAFVESAGGGDEIGQLVDLISTNHTRFFREPEHFTYLAQRILPEWIPRLAAEKAPLRVWSAAAASGEEAYTLALVLAEYFRLNPPAADWRVEASDISRRMLTAAELGIYRMNAEPPVTGEILKRYFQKGVGVRVGSCRIRPELKQHVRFQRINLFQPDYPVQRPQHVIFCRNVMIYFDPPSRGILVQKLTRQLASGGYLFVGHSESLMGLHHELESIRQGVYRKP
ncbi:MAG: protein-glutamate O-methyltransferase CheR [Verrucomicrobiae bacterium]|nr:protein-glutamate O-methyltransferase CheR [Verrucomicrobiae bacterium]